MNSHVYIIVSHDLHVNYDVNYVVEVSSSTEVYIAVNYHSLQSFIPWETQCFGPVMVESNKNHVAMCIDIRDYVTM